MSLTSYRAAPPRVKLVSRALSRMPGTVDVRTSAVRVVQFRPKDFLGRLPGAMPIGCGGYVSTRAAFGKAREDDFFDFMTGWTGWTGPKRRGLAISSAKAQPPATRFNGDTAFVGGPMDQPLTSAPLSALQNA